MSEEINLRKLMADAQTPHKALLAQTRGLAKKWAQPGLLDDLNQQPSGSAVTKKENSE